MFKRSFIQTPSKYRAHSHILHYSTQIRPVKKLHFLLSAKLRQEKQDGLLVCFRPMFWLFPHHSAHSLLMSILNRLGRLPAQHVHKWIHTAAYLRTAATESPAKPSIDSKTTASLLNSKHHGRHRSSKLKQTMAKATLPGNAFFFLPRSAWIVWYEFE